MASAGFSFARPLRGQPFGVHHAAIVSRARSPRHARRVGQRKPDPAATTGAARRESRVAPQAQSAAPGVHSILSLQETLGNQQVARLLAGELSSAPGFSEVRSLAKQQANANGPIQRSRIDYAKAKETIYNTTSSADQQFQPAQYGGRNVRYLMTRSADAVTVTVRIKFVNQARGTREFLPDGTKDPDFRQPINSPSEIPANDERRGFAERMCRDSIEKHWNKRFVLVGRRRSPPAASGSALGSVGATGAAAAAGAAAATAATSPSTTPAAPAAGASGAASAGEIRLPVKFVATPVFDLATEDYDKLVRLYGQATVAGSAGHPIDAGNFYMNRGTYGGSAESTYAHEFGHLIGINDEYSRSNDQMHNLMHQVSPSAATRMNTELDRETTKRMILAALRPQLRANIASMGAEVAAAFEDMREGLKQQLAQGIRNGWRQADVIADIIEQVGDQLEGPESERLRAALAQAVRFEARDNLSNITYAQEVLDVALSPAEVQSQLSRLYASAINAAITAPIALQSTDNAGRPTTINISAELAAPLQPTAPGSLSGTLNTAATTISNQSAGAGAATGPGGALVPAIAPSASLLGSLTALPAAWRGRGAVLSPYVDESEAALDISEAWSALLTTTDFSGAGDVRTLYRMLYESVHSLAVGVGKVEVQRFFEAEMNPLIREQLSSLGTLIDQEAARIGSAANPPPRAGGPDPLADAVAQMQVAMRDRLAAQTPSGAAAEPAAGTQTQAVRYDVQGLMGDNTASTVVRPDFLNGLVTQFNLPANGLIDTATEESFRSETT